MTAAWKVVEKITDAVDPKEVLCTTYQMRNMYSQLGTAFFSGLDVMNYIQHHVAALMASKNDRVLDVCCGRGLILPLLRWYRKEIFSYVGVDIKPSNFAEAQRRAGTTPIANKRFAVNSPGTDEPYYPFEIHYVPENVAKMAEPLTLLNYAPFDLVVYTASIEHMQRDAGIESLRQCYEVMNPNAIMFLSSPNTTEKSDPYDTQYAAHLYEWPRLELLEAVESMGFNVKREFGLVAKVRGYRDNLKQHYPELLEVFDQFSEYLPSAWLYSFFPIITPKIADEIAFVIQK